MRYTKINPKAVSTLRDRIHITQQELASRVGCSLSAVQFWEAGRSSPRGYRLRRLMELCPDEECRSLFFALPLPAEVASTVHDSKLPLSEQAEWEKRYLDTKLRRSLPLETRKLYSEAVENILRLSVLKVGGNQVAAEGLHSLAEAIKQAVRASGESDSTRRSRLRNTSLPSESKGHSE